MRITLNDIEESRENQMIQKAKENDSLQNAINDIRLKSRQVNYEINQRFWWIKLKYEEK